MNTDMNSVLDIQVCYFKFCKKNDSLSAESLVGSPFVFTEYISSWRASKTLIGLTNTNQGYMLYIYIVRDTIL